MHLYFRKNLLGMLLFLLFVVLLHAPPARPPYILLLWIIINSIIAHQTQLTQFTLVTGQIESLRCFRLMSVVCVSIKRNRQVNI